MSRGIALDVDADGMLHLPALAADPVRAARVRQRCRAQLADGARKRARRAAACDRAARVCATLIVGAVCAVYAAALVIVALGVEGFVP